MRILGISGSLRAGSHNTQLLRVAAEQLPGDVEYVELDREVLRAVPAFDEDDEGRADGIDAVRAFRDAIREADALLFAVPEYNGSIPGALKNALDWASRPREDAPLAGKPAAVIGASKGLFGAVWAQAELRKVLTTAGAKVVDRELPLPQAHDAFDEAGQPLEPALREQLAEHVAELVDAVPQSV